MPTRSLQKRRSSQAVTFELYCQIAAHSGIDANLLLVKLNLWLSCLKLNAPSLNSARDLYRLSATAAVKAREFLETYRQRAA